VYAAALDREEPRANVWARRRCERKVAGSEIGDAQVPAYELPEWRLVGEGNEAVLLLTDREAHRLELCDELGGSHVMPYDTGVGCVETEMNFMCS